MHRLLLILLRLLSVAWSHDDEVFPTSFRDPESSHYSDLWDDDYSDEMPAILSPSGLEEFHEHYPQRTRSNSDSSLTDATRASKAPASSPPDYMAALEEFRSEGVKHHELFRELPLGSSNITRAVELLQFLDDLDRVVQQDLSIMDFLGLLVRTVDMTSEVIPLNISMISDDTVAPVNTIVRYLTDRSLIVGTDIHESVPFLIRRSFLPLLVHILLHDLTVVNEKHDMYRALAELLIAFLSSPTLQGILIEPFITVVSREQLGLYKWFREGFPLPNAKYDLNAPEGDKMFHCQELDLGKDIYLADVIVSGLEGELFDRRQRALPLTIEGHRRKYYS
ncbi:hypothetical protein CPB85DRAFT_246009 [Mucidula mucida]|nr:hypothetical protein CPB85DRAFT_246009 [Mucidula mucida]